jgi:hypothetical protein
MKIYGGSGGIAPQFLTSTLDGGEWSASRPGRFTPGTHWIGGRVDPRVGLDIVEKRKIFRCQESKSGLPYMNWDVPAPLIILVFDAIGLQIRYWRRRKLTPPPRKDNLLLLLLYQYIKSIAHREKLTIVSNCRGIFIRVIFLYIRFRTIFCEINKCWRIQDGVMREHEVGQRVKFQQN